MHGVRKFVIMFLIRFHQSSKKNGLSSLTMCYLLFADARDGVPVSKTEIADQIGVSRAGVNKMILKTEDLVIVETMPDGLYRLWPTEKGRRHIGMILGSL